MTDFTLLSVMKYLKDNKFEQTWLSLENQSQIRLFTFPKQIQFFRKIILKGDFNEGKQFVDTLKNNLPQKVYRNSCLTIYKQKLYELIDIPNQKQLKKLFQKEIISFCTEQQFQTYFTLLTCRKTQQIQGNEDWTVLKGRLSVFEQLLPVIQSVLYNNKPVNQSYLNSAKHQINLDEAVALYVQNNENNASNIQGKISQVANKSQLANISNKSSNLNQSQSMMKQNKREPQLELSQSHYQKSQFVGGTDKKSRLYGNNLSEIKQKQSHFTRSGPGSKIKESNYSHHNPSKNEYQGGSRLYQEEQINQISEQQQKSDTVRSNNRMQKSKMPQNKYVQPMNSQSQQIQSSSRQNIEYLQQTNSVVYNNEPDRDHQNFTFSHHNLTTQMDKPRKVSRLATIPDNKAIRTCQFSSSGSYFAVGTNSSILKIFDVSALFSQNKYRQIEPIYEINGLHSKSIFCLNWAKDQASMVTCSNDLTIKLTQFNHDFSSHQMSVIGRHEACIRMVKFNQQHNKIFSCSDDSLIKVWDMGKVKRCYNLKGHTAGISAFKICQNQNQLYSVSKDSTIKRWDLRTLECIATSNIQESQMTFIADNTQRIVTSNRSGNVLFFDQQLNLEYQVKIHDEEIRSIQASKGQDLFLTASFDGHVGLFSQKNIHSPDYFQHNQNPQDKVVFATFLDHPQYRGFASTSTLGLCHIDSYF